MTRDEMLAHLRAADEVAREAAAHGHHPFGAVLVGPTIASSCGRAISTRCATPRPSSAAAPPPPIRRSSSGRCTLVTTFEPCAMCAGTLYWANIGALVYGVEETKLLALTGAVAGEPDDEPLLAHGARLRPEDRSTSTAPSPRSRTS